jgi:hypothetical protein
MTGEWLSMQHDSNQPHLIKQKRLSALRMTCANDLRSSKEWKGLIAK